MFKPKVRNTDTYRFAPAHIKEVYGHNELYFRLHKPMIKVYGQVRGRLSLDTLEKDRPKIVKHCDWLIRELDSDIMGRICSEYSNHVNAINIDTTYGDHKIYIYSLDTLSSELEKYSHRDYLIPWEVELELRQNNRDLIKNQQNMESWFRFLYDDSRNSLIKKSIFFRFFFLRIVYGISLPHNWIHSWSRILQGTR